MAAQVATQDTHSPGTMDSPLPCVNNQENNQRNALNTAMINTVSQEALKVLKGQ